MLAWLFPQNVMQSSHCLPSVYRFSWHIFEEFGSGHSTLLMKHKWRTWHHHCVCSCNTIPASYVVSGLKSFMFFVLYIYIQLFVLCGRVLFFLQSFKCLSDLSGKFNLRKFYRHRLNILFGGYCSCLCLEFIICSCYIHVYPNKLPLFVLYLHNNAHQ